METRKIRTKRRHMTEKVLSTKDLKANGEVRQHPENSVKERGWRMIHAASPPLLCRDLLSLPLEFDLQRRASTRLSPRSLAHLPSDASDVKFRSEKG